MCRWYGLLVYTASPQQLLYRPYASGFASGFWIPDKGLCDKCYQLPVYVPVLQPLSLLLLQACHICLNRCITPAHAVCAQALPIYVVARVGTRSFSHITQG